MNFPINPTLNQTYTYGGKTWKWDGTAWNLQAAGVAQATVAFTGSFSDLINKPTTLSGYGITDGFTLPTQTGNTGKFLTTNGTAASWGTVSGSISVTGGDITLSGSTGTAITNATLATVNANVGSFGSSSAIPVITVNAKGLITAVSTSSVSIPSGSISVTGGDFTLSGNTGTAITNATLATVNANVGSFGSSSAIPVITVNAKGLITAVSTQAFSAGLTSTYVGFGSGTNTITGSSNLTWNGSTLSVTGTLSATSITETSSIALKQNFRPLENVLENLMKLSACVYDRKDGSSKNEPGLIAEQVYKVIPNIVSTDSSGNPQSICYTRLSVYLLEAIKLIISEINLLGKDKQ
jgi:hypothetical protein